MEVCQGPILWGSQTSVMTGNHKMDRGATDAPNTASHETWKMVLWKVAKVTIFFVSTKGMACIMQDLTLKQKNPLVIPFHS